jgi:hypothetical protein
MSSLIATFRPAQTNYLFYVYKGDGTHAFAETYEEHLANIRLYRRSGATARSIPSGAGATEQSPIVATETTGTLTAHEGSRETSDEQVGAKESNEESKGESPRSGSEQRRQGSSRRTRPSGSRR